MPAILTSLADGRDYQAHVVEGLASADPRVVLPTALAGAKVALIADEKVLGLHGDEALGWLKNAGLEVVAVVRLAGEEFTKSLEVAGRVYVELATAGIERGDLVVGFGGGVIGDLAGFVASTWKRGVELAHLPTTLLSQVDSCLGGKTAVNLGAGKNLVGTFHQPSFILASAGFLGTLDDRQFRSGLAEAIKTAALFDEPLFAWIENLAPRGANDLPPASARELVERCLSHKSRVVTLDEREGGMRKLLNLGHTLGHALETATGHSDALFHGEAVAIGMVAAAGIAEAREVAPAGTRARIATLLERCGLPVTLPVGVTHEAILTALDQDKKRSSGRDVWILPTRIGEARVEEGIAREELLAVISS